MDKVFELKKIIEKGVDIILPAESIEEKLRFSIKEKKPLIVKLGFDPTSPDLHLGHAVVLKKLKEFQDFGHKVVLIIGDFTAAIGDPTGKNKTRPPLSADKIKENSKTYINQLSKILDVDKIQIRYNSEWLSKMNLTDVIQLLSVYNLGRMLVRNDFRKRFENETPIAMHELIYPLLQGYDSLEINADIEIGGTDQLFNLQVGRFLQETKGLPSQSIICMPLLRGTDGTDKMSKSLNNSIGLTDNPNQMFGKVMSIPDALLIEYIDLASSFNDKEKIILKESLKNGENPINIKKQIAFNIVEQFHSIEDAKRASEYFYNQFQNKNQQKIKYIEFPFSKLGVPSKIDLVTLLLTLKVRPSKTTSRSLIEQGGVLVDGNKIVDSRFVVEILDKDVTLKCGKLNFYKIIVNK